MKGRNRVKRGEELGHKGQKGRVKRGKGKVWVKRGIGLGLRLNRQRGGS